MTDQQYTPLCLLHDLPDPGSRGMTVKTHFGVLEILLVHKAGKVFGYINRCPHTGVNLDWSPDKFLDLTNSFIQCATHGALFRIEDGVCLHGPCAGDRLKAIELRIERGTVFFGHTEL